MGGLERALAAFDLASPQVDRIPIGLLHQSFAVRDGAVEYVLQCVNPVFEPGIHENIRAVTERLKQGGLETLELVHARDGALVADLGEDGLWRLMTRLPGVVFACCASTAQAASAGALVARFHGALDGLEHTFRPLGIALHDTPVHLRALERALTEEREHRLYGDVEPVGRAILAAARALPEPAQDLPLRVVHGDLKFDNVLFAGESGADAERATALIDLDTMCRLPLWAELGDAWRSWCNRAGEDAVEAAFDPELFRSAAGAYLEAGGLALVDAERASLLDGLERICLELASRFCADALRESYFGWDPERFSGHGEHNLVRARGQLDLHRQVLDARAERARVLGL
jgi:Ser/Thr protein kinase RdoA (MazF antagonist)